MKRILVGSFAFALVGCAAMQDPDFSRKLEVALRGASQIANAGAPNGYYQQPAYQPQYRPVDIEWDWDQFYHGPQLRWACRGVQSGQFASEENCMFKAKTDLRWPEKFL